MRSDGRTVGQSGALRKRLALAGAVVLLSFSPTVRLSAQAVDRTKPPTLPPPPALKLPAVQVDTLPNGLTVAVVEMHKVPLVDVQVLVDAGARSRSRTRWRSSGGSSARPRATTPPP